MVVQETRRSRRNTSKGKKEEEGKDRAYNKNSEIGKASRFTVLEEEEQNHVEREEGSKERIPLQNISNLGKEQLKNGDMSESTRNIGNKEMNKGGRKGQTEKFIRREEEEKRKGKSQQGTPRETSKKENRVKTLERKEQLRRDGDKLVGKQKVEFDKSCMVGQKGQDKVGLEKNKLGGKKRDHGPSEEGDEESGRRE